MKIGRRVTSLDLLPANEKQNRKKKLLISAGTVTVNINVPSSGGCAVSVRVKFDGDTLSSASPASTRYSSTAITNRTSSNSVSYSTSIPSSPDDPVD